MRDLAPDENGRRSCIIVSIPREGGLENTANALGVYVSVETVRELGEGRVEVVMASCVSVPFWREGYVLTETQSDAGGSIPRFVQNLAIASQLWGDGEKFFRYMRENPEV